MIKPALIGMIGAWISGGIEWNSPHHHRPNVFMPIDHTIENRPDGSATAWIGEMEIRHRMRWVVGLTVYPGKSSGGGCSLQRCSLATPARDPRQSAAIASLLHVGSCN